MHLMGYWEYVNICIFFHSSYVCVYACICIEHFRKCSKTEIVGSLCNSQVMYVYIDSMYA